MVEKFSENSSEILHCVFLMHNRYLLGCPSMHAKFLRDRISTIKFMVYSLAGPVMEHVLIGKFELKFSLSRSSYWFKLLKVSQMWSNINYITDKIDLNLELNSSSFRMMTWLRLWLWNFWNFLEFPGSHRLCRVIILKLVELSSRLRSILSVIHSSWY